MFVLCSDSPDFSFLTGARALISRVLCFCRNKISSTRLVNLSNGSPKGVETRNLLFLLILIVLNYDKSRWKPTFLIRSFKVIGIGWCLRHLLYLLYLVEVYWVIVSSIDSARDRLWVTWVANHSKENYISEVPIRQWGARTQAATWPPTRWRPRRWKCCGRHPTELVCAACRASTSLARELLHNLINLWRIKKDPVSCSILNSHGITIRWKVSEPLRSV